MFIFVKALIGLVIIFAVIKEAYHVKIKKIILQKKVWNPRILMGQNIIQ